MGRSRRGITIASVLGLPVMRRVLESQAQMFGDEVLPGHMSTLLEGDIGGIFTLKEWTQRRDLFVNFNGSSVRQVLDLYCHVAKSASEMFFKS